VRKKNSLTLALGLTEPEGKYVRQIIVYVSKAYEVFKEIFAPRERLWEMIRPHRRGLVEENLTASWAGRITIHPCCHQPSLTPREKIAGSTNRSLPPGFYGATGVTMTHHPGRHIMKDTGPSPNDRIVANRDSGGYVHVCGNPDAVSHGYGVWRGLEVRIVMIMTRSAKKAFLRDDCLLADLDRGDGIEPGVVADPRIIANLDAPGEMQPGPGMHDYLLAEPAPEHF
jgi:hypothetical protein